MQNQSLVCFTTFRQGSPTNPIEQIRSDVFVDTLNKISEAQLPFLVLHIDTQRSLLKKIEASGGVSVKQRGAGMGVVRREALATALAQFPKSEYFFWIEPEKPDMIRFITEIHDLMVTEKTALGLFLRTNLASYPPEQAHYYGLCRSVASQLMGFDIDYGFGPMVISRAVVPYFLNYQSAHGDLWDSILVPRLRIIRNKFRVSQLPIDFKNDQRMTSIESGNPQIVLKRLEQLNNVIPSLINELSNSTSTIA